MRKILIVEDEKNILLSLRMFLKQKGFLVEIAKDGVEAIEKAQSIRPDLILLDVLLPKMNGYLVCKALKEEMITHNIPVIFMSAKTQEEDIRKALAAGGAEYITKPFTLEELQVVLDKYHKGAEKNE